VSKKLFAPAAILLAVTLAACGGNTPPADNAAAPANTTAPAEPAPATPAAPANTTPP
jgi:hypothetical protein